MQIHKVEASKLLPPMTQIPLEKLQIKGKEKKFQTATLQSHEYKILKIILFYFSDKCKKWRIIEIQESVLKSNNNQHNHLM